MTELANDPPCFAKTVSGDTWKEMMFNLIIQAAEPEIGDRGWPQNFASSWHGIHQTKRLLVVAFTIYPVFRLCGTMAGRLQQTQKVTRLIIRRSTFRDLLWNSRNGSERGPIPFCRP